MNVIFVEPFFPANQRQFVRGLAEVGATVVGVGEFPADAFDDELRGWLSSYEQVASVTDVGVMTDVVRRVQARLWVDRLETTAEAHALPVAQVRQACSIPGTSVRTAWLCRDKPSMKEALRQAGIPSAASTAASSAAEALAFAEHVGFPLILKPRAGAAPRERTASTTAASWSTRSGCSGPRGSTRSRSRSSSRGTRASTTP